MELFYAYEASGASVSLDRDESTHCIKVLRHRAGDEVCVIDGKGTMMRCRIVDDSPLGAQMEVLERVPGFGVPGYRLTLACCPTKNNDRFEWLVEKATEMGVDRIVPIIGERSERKVYKSDRARRIALSAAKQSLKALVPEVEEPVSVKEFLQRPLEGLGLIAYCFEGELSPASRTKTFSPEKKVEKVLSDSAVEKVPERISVAEALEGVSPDTPITVLIGPEGDFSSREAALALERGYRPVHLGPSRLRTETAALAAVSAVYFNYIGKAYVSED